MSEEILENTSEEIADETAEESTYASSEEISSEEEQVIEENSKPRTKAGMMKAIYDQLNTLKKAELSDSYESIIGATLAEQDDDEEDEDDDEDEVEEGKLPPALQKAIDKKKGKSKDDDEDEKIVDAERTLGHVACKVFTTLLFVTRDENPDAHRAGNERPEYGEPRCFFHSDDVTFTRQNQQVEYQETYKDSVKNQPVVESFQQRGITFLSGQLDCATDLKVWPVAQRRFTGFWGAKNRKLVHY